jgi:hypothetical protein
MSLTRPLAPSRFALIAATISVVGGLVMTGQAASAATAPTVPATPVSEGQDYATSTFADRWDFANAADLKFDRGPSKGLSGVSFSNGQMNVTVTGNGYVSPVWGGYVGALFLDRDGSRPGNQVAAATYTHFSLRAYASQRTSAGFMWFTCPGLLNSCEGGMPVALEAGWNTYDFVLENRGYGLPKAWSGAIHGVRLALNGSSTGTKFNFDWMRLYHPGNSGTVSGAGSSLQVDDGTAQYTVPCDRGTACTRDLGMLPPGTYRFADPGGPWSAPVQVVARPAATIIGPSDAGCGDWAATTRAGNRWDFNQLTDATKKANVTGGVSGGAFVGTNAAPTVNDPQLYLALPRRINGKLWRRITFQLGYDGAFNLADTKGGGTMARVMWQRAESGVATMQTNDIVTYSGTHTYTVDLGASNVNEPNAPYRYPITSSSNITSLRIDPNEDRGNRHWRLYDVRLAMNCRVARGSGFTISWSDRAFTPGSTASVYVVPSSVARASGGTLVGTVTQAAGTNTMKWTVPAGQATGSYWVYVVTSNGTSSSSKAASGPLVVY